MALKVKAVERLLKFDKESAGKYRYVMKPEMYSSLTQAKVIKEAALRSGVSQGVMKACWDAAGEIEDNESNSPSQGGENNGNSGSPLPVGGDTEIDPDDGD